MVAVCCGGGVQFSHWAAVPGKKPCLRLFQHFGVQSSGNRFRVRVGPYIATRGLRVCDMRHGTLLLTGSLGLSRVISTLLGVISNHSCSCLTYNSNY